MKIRKKWFANPASALQGLLDLATGRIAGQASRILELEVSANEAVARQAQFSDYCKELESSARRMKAELETVKGELQDSRSATRESKRIERAAVKACENQQLEFESLQRKVSYRDRLIVTLRENIANLSEQLDHSDAKLKQSRQQLRELNANLTESDRVKAALARQLGRIKQELASLQHGGNAQKISSDTESAGTVAGSGDEPFSAEIKEKQKLSENGDSSPVLPTGESETPLPIHNNVIPDASDANPLSGGSADWIATVPLDQPALDPSPSSGLDGFDWPAVGESDEHSPRGKPFDIDNFVSSKALDETNHIEDLDVEVELPTDYAKVLSTQVKSSFPLIADDDIPVDDAGPTKHELATIPKRLQREQHAKQIAISLAETFQRDENTVLILKTIFTANWWSSAKSDVEALLLRGATDRELDLANHIRDFWNQHSEFSCQVARSGEQYAHQVSMPWQTALDFVRAYEGYPDINELQEYLIASNNEWSKQWGLQDDFPSFLLYFKAILGNRREGEPLPPPEAIRSRAVH